MKRAKVIMTILLAVVGAASSTLSAQNLLQRVDNMLSERYRKGNIDSAYIVRPSTKWTVSARINESGTKIKTEGVENGSHFTSELTADYKSTLSLAVN